MVDFISMLYPEKNVYAFYLTSVKTVILSFCENIMNAVVGSLDGYFVFNWTYWIWRLTKFKWNQRINLISCQTHSV